MTADVVAWTSCLGPTLPLQTQAAPHTAQLTPKQTPVSRHVLDDPRNTYTHTFHLIRKERLPLM